MSRILVIEPSMTLRYGLAMALTPDHLAQFTDALPEASALKHVDAIVVDAAMLRRGAKAAPADLKTVELWRVPTVWIDDLAPTFSPDRVDWVTLKPPLQRERVLKALLDCLNPATGSLPAASQVRPRSAMAVKPRARKIKEANAPAVLSANVIELVEVVEDESESG